MKYLILISIVITTIGCAEMGFIKDSSPDYRFADTRNRPRAEQEQIFDQCLLIARTVRPALQGHEQESCMVRHGFKYVEVKQ